MSLDMNWFRIAALLRKDLADLRRNRAVLLPVLVTSCFTVALPLVIAIGIPALSGESLASDRELRRALDAARLGELRLAELGDTAAMQAFVFRQFLLFLVLVPISGAMTVAAHSIVGEKQARALEPLLATPLTTAELLVAKVLGAFVPSLVVAALAYAALFLGIAALAAPGVLPAVLNAHALMMIGLVGPLAALVALQLTVLVSARARDPRAAQQAGVLLILPLTGLFVAQMSGVFFLTPVVTTGIAVALLVGWGVLVWISVAAFDREAILTKWK